MAGEVKTGFSGFGATGEGNNSWNTVGNLALNPGDNSNTDDKGGAEIVDFNEEKAKLEEARRLREKIAQKEALLNSAERTIPNESFRALRKQELAGEIDQARERLRELGDKTLSVAERVDSEDVKEAPLAEEVAELEVKQILNGEPLEARYEQIVQEFADKSSDAAAMRKMATEVVKNDGTLLAEREREVDSLRHSKEVLENYAKEHGIELPGMPAEIKSTDMAQYANGEEVAVEAPKELTPEQQEAILAEFDNRKVENENPSAEMLAKVNRANVERAALAMDMPELLEFYDRKMAERAENKDNYLATMGDLDDSTASAGEDLSSDAVDAESVKIENLDLADDDVYNQQKAALEADLQAMEVADGELPQYAQLMAGNALMNILRNRAQREMGIVGKDVMDDRQRKIGEEFNAEDEAKIAAWAEQKMTEVGKYRELQEKLERLEEARAEALVKTGRTEETGDTKAESRNSSNDDFYAAFGRAKDRQAWLRKSMDPDGAMPEKEFAMRFEQTAAAYEVWHNALADGVFEKIGEQKEKGLKGAWNAVKRFAKKQTRKIAGLLAGLSVFGAATVATSFDAEAAQRLAGSMESVDRQENGDGNEDLAAEVNARSEAVGIDENDSRRLDQQAKLESLGLGADEFDGHTYEVAANGAKSEYASYYLDFENKLRYNNYAPSRAEFYGDVDGSIRELIAIATAQPEALASYIAVCEQPVWQQCGINIQKTGDLIQDGPAIDALISNSDAGGEIQERAIEILTKLLTNEQSKASATFNEEYDKELTSYMYTMEDETGNFTPETMHLGYDIVQRTGEKQFNIDLYDENGVKMGSLDLNMDCGFQTNIELADPTATYVTTETGTPVENVVITETVTEETPEQTDTPEEVTDKDEGEPDEEIPDDKQEGETPPTEEEKPPVEEEKPPVEEEKPTEEQIKQKDPQNQINVVENGGQTNPVGQTPSSTINNNVPGTIVTPSNQNESNMIPQGDITGNLTGTYDVTPEDTSIPTTNVYESTEAGQQDDSEASEEQQGVNRENQEAANQGEITNSMSQNERENWADNLG